MKKLRRVLTILLIVLIIILLIIIGMKAVEAENERTGDLGIRERLDNISGKEKKDDTDEVSETEADTGIQELMTAEAAQKLVERKEDGTYVEDKEYAAGEITCDETATFSGQFVEDGRDELVENVAAIRVTKHSEQYLEFSTLIYEINGQTATFVATGLPPGKSAWVMEKSRMIIDNGSEFHYQGSTTSFKADVGSTSDQIEITSDGNMLTATNKSKKEMENIVVYYKVLHDDGNFFGGITYVVDFGNVKAGESKKTLAGHYAEGKAEIVRLDWQEK